MKKSLNYQIAKFAEAGYSISHIKSIMESSNKTCWKTKSDSAVLEILFEPVGDFEVHLAILTPIILKVSTESGISFEKQFSMSKSKKSKKITLSPKKHFKLDPLFVKLNFLKFEFTKIDDFIEIQYLLLQAPKNESFQKKSSSKTFKQVSLKLHKKPKEINSKTFNEPKRHDSPLSHIENGQTKEFISQQERMKCYLVEEVKEKEYNLRSSAKVLTVSNSYKGLFKGQIVCVLIENETLKGVVIELLNVFEAIYMEELSDICSFVICEKVIGFDGIREVSVKWLFECAEKREMLPFEI